jgi:hypothetical protein
MEQFEQQMDLKEPVDKWMDKESVDKTWPNFKIFFSKEIKKNKFKKGTFKEVGLANAAQQQRLDTSCENQQVLAATSIEHHNVIESLLTRIDKMESAATPAPALAPAQANAATTTDSNAKMMEMMMSMMSKMTTGGSTGENGGGGKKAFVSQRNDKNGKRSNRRYNNDNYCWTCGFDLGHTSST